MDFLIFPSLIAGNLLHLAEEIQRLEPHVEGFHLDIEDGHFVPNLTWGLPFIHQIREITTKTMWIHLMVDNPTMYQSNLHLLSGDLVSIHYESAQIQKIKYLIEFFKNENIHAGVALNPQTETDCLKSIFTSHEPSNPHHILLMSVNPGFSGKTFLPTALAKLLACAQFRKSHELTYKIALDGGINTTNIALIKQNVDLVAVGSGIFRENNPIDAIKQLRRER